MGNLSQPANPNIDINQPQQNLLWWRSAALSIGALYVYLFMEWLFIVTKPSFMDVMAIGQKFEVLMVTSLFLVILWLPGFLLLFGLSKIPWFSKIWWVFLYVSGLVPAGVLAITTLLVVDNFTYTLFSFGIVSSMGIWRGLYAVLFTLVFIL
ncbi:MAG: hypothetical protein ACK2UW_10640, partial [Anaerolineales bacterium]